MATMIWEPIATKPPVDMCECWRGPRTLETEILSLWAETESLKANRTQQEQRIRYIEKMLDTAGTPLWKRIWFRLDGWPAWWVVATRRAWRPWHRDRWPLSIVTSRSRGA